MDHNASIISSGSFGAQKIERKYLKIIIMLQVERMIFLTKYICDDFQDLNYKWLQSKKKKPWINLFWLKHFFYIRRFIPLNAFTLQKNVYCLWKFLSLILIYRYCLIHRYCLISLFRNWKLCIHTFKYWCWLYSC